jgi:hypothetical protein
METAVESVSSTPIERVGTPLHGHRLTRGRREPLLPSKLRSPAAHDLAIPIDAPDPTGARDRARVAQALRQDLKP